MQAVSASQKLEIRLLIIGMLWLLAGGLAYLLARQPGALWFLPPDVEYRLAPIPLQQISDTFPMFAAVIALSLLCVWLSSCGKGGAACICGAWTLLEVFYQFGQRPDVASWILPRLPGFMHWWWPMNQVDRLLGSGAFNVNDVAGAMLGGIFAYMVVLNSIPGRRWQATPEPLRYNRA